MRPPAVLQGDIGTDPSPMVVHTTEEIEMLDIKVVTWSLGIFTTVSFLVCVLYGLVVPQSLHMSQFLEAVLPAFTWLTFWGFWLGLIESFLYGVYAGLVFVPIYNLLGRRMAVTA